jgi:hypothetical protein
LFYCILKALRPSISFLKALPLQLRIIFATLNTVFLGDARVTRLTFDRGGHYLCRKQSICSAILLHQVSLCSVFKFKFERSSEYIGKKAPLFGKNFLANVAGGKKYEEGKRKWGNFQEK